LTPISDLHFPVNKFWKSLNENRPARRTTRRGVVLGGDYRNPEKKEE